MILRLALILAALGAPLPARAQKPRGFEGAWSGVHTAFDSTLRQHRTVGGTLWFLQGDRLQTLNKLMKASRSSTLFTTPSMLIVSSL